MSNDFSRMFCRIAKRLSGDAPGIGDLSSVVACKEPKSLRHHKAKRQFDSDHWRVIEVNETGFGLNQDLLNGASLAEALDKLEEIESGYAVKVRGKKLPRNHYSKVREMLAAENSAAPAAAPVETQNAVAVKAPLALARKS